MKRRVSVMVSAMILAAQLGSPLAAEEPTVEQLALIAEHLAEDDVQALRTYLRLNPELLEGDAELTLLLRQFMEQTSDLTQYFDFEPDLRDSVQDTITRSANDFEPAAGSLY